MRRRPDGKPLLTSAPAAFGTSRSGRLEASRAFSAGLAAILSIAILSLAVPRFASALCLLPGRAAIELVENGVRPSDAGILRAVDAQAAVLRVMARASPHMDTAYLAQSLAESAGFADADVPGVLAVARLVEALSMAPGHARGWLMFAGMRLGDGDEAGAASAIGVSFAADAHLPRLAPFRWPMTHRLGRHLPRSTRERASLELLSSFRAQPKIAVRMALRQDRLAELTALTSERSEDRRHLERVVPRMRPDGAGA
jgi:hypothetical protein